MMGFGGGIGGLFFLVVLIGLAVWGVRTLQAQRDNQRDALPSPLETLRHRYAAGEIDREEFECVKQDLGV